MNNQHYPPPPDPVFTTNEAGFLVSSPCGRQWFVPLAGVAKDYASYRMQADGLTQEQADAESVKQAEFLPTWFYEQFIFEEVEHYGRLVTTSTRFKTKKALDRRRGRLSDAKVEEFNIPRAVRGQAESPPPRFTEPGYLVSSPCDRQWFVPLTAVADDYASFRMEADGLTKAQADAEATKQAKFIPQWFYEQFICWEDVERCGRLVTESTRFKTKKALNRYRGDYDDAVIEEFNLPVFKD